MAIDIEIYRHIDVDIYIHISLVLFLWRTLTNAVA